MTTKTLTGRPSGPDVLRLLRPGVLLCHLSGLDTPLGDDGLVRSMRTDPDPIDAVLDIKTKCPIVRSHPYSPEFINLFEVERRMPRIRLQECIVLVRQCAYMHW